MIFETLYLLFKADTGDLKKNTKDAQGYTDKLKKSFEGMTGASSLLDESFLKLTNSIGNLVTAGLSVYGVFEGFKTALDFGNSISQTSRKLGVNVTELNKWGNAVQYYGGNADSFSNSIQNLSDKFGILPENAVKLLSYLQPVFSKLNKLQQFQLGQNYGLDQSLIQLLGSGNQRFRELFGIQEQLRPLTKENAEGFLKFNDALIHAKQATTSLFTQILIKSLPSLTTFLNVFSELATKVINNDSALQGAFKGLAISVSILAGAFLLLNPSIAIITGLIAGITALSTYFGVLDNSNPDKTIDRLGNSAKNATEWFKGLRDIIDAIVWGIDKIDAAIDKFSNFEKSKASTSQALQNGSYNALSNLSTLLPSQLDTQRYGITHSNTSNSNENNYNITSGDTIINASNVEDANEIARILNVRDRQQSYMHKQTINNFVSGSR